MLTTFVDTTVDNRYGMGYKFRTKEVGESGLGTLGSRVRREQRSRGLVGYLVEIVSVAITPIDQPEQIRMPTLQGGILPRLTCKWISLRVRSVNHVSRANGIDCAALDAKQIDVGT